MPPSMNEVYLTMILISLLYRIVTTKSKQSRQKETDSESVMHRLVTNRFFQGSARRDSHWHFCSPPYYFRSPLILVLTTNSQQREKETGSESCSTYDFFYFIFSLPAPSLLVFRFRHRRHFVRMKIAYLGGLMKTPPKPSKTVT